MSYASTSHVSADNTPEDPRLQPLSMVPLGAAVWTSSGDLAKSGITAIAQAASGAAGHQGQSGFDPTRSSVELSLANSFRLAHQQGYGSLAVPFVAGGIFFKRIAPPIDKQALANLITGACVAHRGDVKAVIVAYGDEDTGYFEQSLQHIDDAGVSLVSGSITAYSDHGCAAIVNAANMEVRFGGGVSGIIGDATGQATAIDAEAADYVAEFWAANAET